MDDKAFWMARRQAALIEIHAIEERFPTSTVTIVVRRADIETNKGINFAAKSKTA